MAGAAEFIAILKSQDGYHEGRNADGSWNNNQKYSLETQGMEWSNYQPWCAVFECWGARKVGLANLFPFTASCATAVSWWQHQGRWSAYPAIGALFYMGPGGSSHTGVVTSYTHDTITTIEGNTNVDGGPDGDGVHVRTRPRRGTGSPYGYGVPNYAEGVTSADPKWGGTDSASEPVISTPAPSGSPVLLKPYPGYVMVKNNTSYDANVKAFQQRMIDRGWNVGPKGADGWFGNLTEAKVIAFQKEKFPSDSSQWDGKVGPKTWTAMFRTDNVT